MWKEEEVVRDISVWRDTMTRITKSIKGTGKISARISEVECVYNVGISKGENMYHFQYLVRQIDKMRDQRVKYFI